MKNWIVRVVIALVLLAIGFIAGHRSSGVVEAQGGLSIPKAWGHCIGSLGDRLIFEDSSGTIRTVKADYGTLVSMITRN